MDENAGGCRQCLDAWRAFQLWKDWVNDAGYELTDGRRLQIDIVQKTTNHTKEDCLRVLRDMITSGEVDHIFGAPEMAWRQAVRRLAERYGVLHLQWASETSAYVTRPGSYLEAQAEESEAQEAAGGNGTGSGHVRRLRDSIGLLDGLLGGSGSRAGSRPSAAPPHAGGGAAWGIGGLMRRPLGSFAPPLPVPRPPPRRRAQAESAESGARVEFDVNTRAATWARGAISRLFEKHGSQTKRWAFMWLAGYEAIQERHERICSRLADYAEGFGGASVLRLPVDTANILSFTAEINAHPEKAPQVVVYCTEYTWTFILQSITRDIFTPLAEMVGLPVGTVGFESAGGSAAMNYILEPTPGPPIDDGTAFDVFGSYRVFGERFRSAFGEDPGWAAIQAASAGVLLTQALRGVPGGDIDTVNLIDYLNSPAVAVATPLGVLNYTKALHSNDRVGVQLQGVRQFRPLAETAPKMLRYKRSGIVMVADEAVNTSDPLAARAQLTFPRPSLTETRVEVYPCEGGCETTGFACTACPPGRYRPPFSDEYGALFACVSCPTGSYASLSGMHRCGRAAENSEILDPEALPAALPGFWLGSNPLPKGALDRCSIAEEEDPPYEIVVQLCHPSEICVGGTEVCAGLNKGPLCGACEAGNSYMGVWVDRHSCRKCPGRAVLALQSCAVLLQWVMTVAVLASLCRQSQKRPAHMPFLLLRTMFHTMQVVSIAFEASKYANDVRSGPVVFLIFVFTRQLEILMLDCWAYELGLSSPLGFIRFVAVVTIPVGILLMLIGHAIFAEMKQNLTHFQALMAVIDEARQSNSAIVAKVQSKSENVRSSALSTQGMQDGKQDGKQDDGRAVVASRSVDKSRTSSTTVPVSQEEFEEQLEEMWEDHLRHHVNNDGFLNSLLTNVQLRHRQISAGLEFLLIVSVIVNIIMVSSHFEAVADLDSNDDLAVVNTSHKVVLAASFVSLTFGLIFDRSICSRPTSLLELVLSFLDALDFIMFVVDIGFEAVGVNRRIIFLISYARLIRITGLARIMKHLLDALLEAYEPSLRMYVLTQEGQGCFLSRCGKLKGRLLYSKNFTIEEAKIVASALPGCGGFCFQKPVDLEVDPCSDEVFLMHFQDTGDVLTDSASDCGPEWHSFIQDKYIQEVGVGAAYQERLRHLQSIREKRIRWPLMLSWTMVSFPSCLRILLRVTQCISLGPRRVLDFDTRVPCDDSFTSPRFAAMAIGMVVPLLLFILSAVAKSRDPQAIETRSRFGMLVIGYKLGGWYWEALIFLFLSLLCFASHVEDPVLRMFIMSAIVVSQLLATSILHPLAPYARDTTFNMERLGLLCALVMLAGSEPIVHQVFPSAGAIVLPYFFKIRTAVFVSMIVYYLFVLSCAIISLPLEMIAEAGGSVTYVNRVAECFAILLKRMRGVNPVFIYYEDCHQVLDVSKLSLGEKHLLANNLAKLIVAALEYEGGLHVQVIENLLAACFANARNARVQQLRSIYEKHGTLNHAIAPCCSCFSIALRAPDVPVNDAKHRAGVSIDELILAVNEVLQDIVDPMTLAPELRRPKGHVELSAVCAVDEHEATQMEATIQGLEGMIKRPWWASQ